MMATEKTRTRQPTGGPRYLPKVSVRDRYLSVLIDFYAFKCTASVGGADYVSRNMSGVKEEALKLIDGLPEEVSWDVVIYQTGLMRHPARLAPVEFRIPGPAALPQEIPTLLLHPA